MSMLYSARVRTIMPKLHGGNPQIHANIFHCVRCVDLATVRGYKLDGAEHHFLDRY